MFISVVVEEARVQTLKNLRCALSVIYTADMDVARGWHTRCLSSSKFFCMAHTA